MGKLYYITGNDAQIREKVYCEIFKWSQAQQMHPLKSYPTPEGEAPNFYLYDYLGYGEKECFVQLVEQYGDEAVEFIYLRTPEEAESALFEEDVFQSYDPYTNLAQCLQEIVETVFTGYHKTTYDFAAALQAEPVQKEEPVQQDKPSPKVTPPIIRPILFVVAWALLVCLITVALFHVFTKQPDPIQTGGNLIAVTNPATPAETASPTTGEKLQQNLFSQPMPDGYVIDLSAPVKTAGQVGYHFNYTGKGQEYHNYLAGTGSNLEADYYATSMDGSVGVVLLDSSLWYLNQTGSGKVADAVSHCVLSATGNDLFYFSNDTIYCVDTKNNIREKLFAASDVKEMAASPNGKYCAYLKSNGTITIINREQKTTKDIAGLEYNTLYTVSNDGGWVCGRSYLDNNKNYLLCMGTNGAIKWITDEKTDCYIPFSGENMIFEMMNQVWIAEASGGYSLRTLPMSGDWRLLFTSENCLYEVADGIYMYDERTPFYVQIGDSLFTLEYKEGAYVLELYSQDLLYDGENVFLQQSDVSSSLFQKIKYVLSANKNGDMLFVNNENFLCGYEKKVGYLNIYTKFSDVKSYATAKDGTVYYCKENGALGWVNCGGETERERSSVENWNAESYVTFEVNNAGVYLYHYTSTNDSVADVYFVQEDTCLFLGTEIGGVAG